MRDSAQQIWQAGLGAFHRAQAEGSKAFEALVNEGVAMQRKTQSAAQAKLAEAVAQRRQAWAAADSTAESLPAGAPEGALEAELEGFALDLRELALSPGFSAG